VVLETSDALFDPLGCGPTGRGWAICPKVEGHRAWYADLTCVGLDDILYRVETDSNIWNPWFRVVPLPSRVWGCTRCLI